MRTVALLSQKNTDRVIVDPFRRHAEHSTGETLRIYDDLRVTPKIRVAHQQLVCDTASRALVHVKLERAIQEDGEVIVPIYDV